MSVQSLRISSGYKPLTNFILFNLQSFGCNRMASKNDYEYAIKPFLWKETQLLAQECEKRYRQSLFLTPRTFLFIL